MGIGGNPRFAAAVVAVVVVIGAAAAVVVVAIGAAVVVFVVLAVVVDGVVAACFLLDFLALGEGGGLGDEPLSLSRLAENAILACTAALLLVRSLKPIVGVTELFELDFFDLPELFEPVDDAMFELF